jgi:hypothetical protein
MLDSLSSPAYLATAPSHLGLLLHGVGHLPAGQEIDVSLIYGDYYFVEAILRAVPLRAARSISFGSTWAYNDRGVDPGPAWTSPAYDDSAWPRGPAQLGYGDGDEVTALTRLTPSQPSLYFRRRITLESPVHFASLRALHDDGVAVWINGTLVFSQLVGSTSHAAYATATSAENQVTGSALALSPNPFRVGDNVVAVMVKQAGPTSSDASFDLELFAAQGSPPGPTVAIVSPNGGESLTPGQTFSIRWTSTGLGTTVDLELSLDGGTSWQVIAADVPSSGEYAWTVPQVSTTSALVRVTDAANPSLTDRSDATFTIASAPTVATVIPFGSVWRYDARNVDPGPQWTSITFNDSTWGMGPAQLGYGDGDEATTLPRPAVAQPSVYFRRHFMVSGTVTRADLRVRHDDGVAVFVNGVQVYGEYLARGLAHGAYASATSAENELSTQTLSLSPNPFRAGDNVVAVMIKQAGPTSSDLSFDLELTLTTTGGAPPPERTVTVIPTGSTWRFNDTGTDLGTAWLALGYSDAAWGAGPAQLGYGDGDEATLLRRTSPALPTYYFRTVVMVDGDVTAAQLRVLFDDAAAVWINGRLVFTRNMGNGTSHSVFASGSSGDNAVVDAMLDLSTNPFVRGPNVVAVMVKQVNGASSDVSFDLALTLTLQN